MEKDAKRFFIDSTVLIEFTFPYYDLQEKGQDFIDICAEHEEYELCQFIKDLIEGNDERKRNDFSLVDKELFNTVLEGLNAKKTKSWQLSASGETVL